MATIPARSVSNRHLLLDGVDWRTYSRLLHVFAERPAVRLTYDRGSLEIMSPLYEHEGDSYLLGRFVDTLTEEMGLPVKAGGSTTLRRRRKRRGLEPDRCYWIAQEPKVRGKRRIDLRTDPPPDLGIEVDVTSSSLDRMAIYAALRVPEVWRLEGSAVTFHVLGADGKYAAVNNSLSFPVITPADLNAFLALHATQDDNTVIRQFRAWIRQRLGGSRPTPAP